ncbi:MAG: glycosyltransferase [Planctomycetota bacterium]
MTRASNHLPRILDGQGSGTTTDPPYAPQYAATVVLATFNRKDELRKAIQSSLDQTVPVEVIVLDDGSTDGTPDMVRAEFPQVRLYQDGVKLGPNRNRHRGIELATAPVVFPIDDDAQFLSPHTVEQTLGDFDDPLIGVVAVPFHEVDEDVDKQAPPDTEHCYVSPRYIGCCVAMRREVFLSCGGYSRGQFNYGEESDLCLRMLANGFLCRLGRADKMSHHRSPVRDPNGQNFRMRRNAITRAWQNVPLILLIPAWSGLSLMYFRHKSKTFSRWATAKALGAGFAAIIGGQIDRKPVSYKKYRVWMKYRKRDPLVFGQSPLLIDQVRGWI